MNAASQLYMAGLGHLVMVSNGHMLHECSILVVHGSSGHLVMLSNGQLLHDCIISIVHDRSESSCNGK